MSKLKTYDGHGVEHWLDKARREHKDIRCGGNYIKIPASAWVKIQQYRNRVSGKKQTLYEANEDYESGASNY